jgi:hypothetical protein
MSRITNEDLVLLYYGEHDDQGLAARVAATPELSERFERLCAELGRIDHFEAPERGEDYGVDTWLAISPKLAAEPIRPPGMWGRLKAAAGQPRLSYAGVFSLLAVVTVAFLLGRESGHPGMPVDAGQQTVLNGALQGLNTERLLTSSVAGHLDRVNLVLTEFAHAPESGGGEAERATDMLVANRLYRQAAEARGDRVLAAFLAELEPMLIELAYEAHRNSPATRDRMQREVRDNLLLRIRLISQQLQNPTLST